LDILARTKLKDAYDDIEIAIQNIKKDPKQEFILDLQNALNKFFDAKCLRVLYTNNTDKLFFGIYAMPKIDAEQVINEAVQKGTAIGYENGPSVEAGMLTNQHIIEQMFQDIITNGKDPMAAAKDAEKQLNDLFETVAVDVK